MIVFEPVTKLTYPDFNSVIIKINPLFGSAARPDYDSVPRIMQNIFNVATDDIRNYLLMFDTVSDKEIVETYDDIDRINYSLNSADMIVSFVETITGIVKEMLDEKGVYYSIRVDAVNSKKKIDNDYRFDAVVYNYLKGYHLALDRVLLVAASSPSDAVVTSRFGYFNTMLY